MSSDDKIVIRENNDKIVLNLLKYPMMFNLEGDTLHVSAGRFGMDDGYSSISEYQQKEMGEILESYKVMGIKQAVFHVHQDLCETSVRYYITLLSVFELYFPKVEAKVHIYLSDVSVANLTTDDLIFASDEVNNISKTHSLLKASGVSDVDLTLEYMLLSWPYKSIAVAVYRDYEDEYESFTPTQEFCAKDIIGLEHNLKKVKNVNSVIVLCTPCLLPRLEKMLKVTNKVPVKIITPFDIYPEFTQETLNCVAFKNEHIEMAEQDCKILTDKGYNISFDKPSADKMTVRRKSML